MTSLRFQIIHSIVIVIAIAALCVVYVKAQKVCVMDPAPAVLSGILADEKEKAEKAV